MRPLPPIRLENGAPTGRNHNPIQRWPDRDGYRAAERFSDVSMMPADEVPASDVRWLWPGTIAIGHLTLVAGEPGSGKSFWMADLAARITFARPWPGAWHGQETGHNEGQETGHNEGQGSGHNEGQETGHDSCTETEPSEIQNRRSKIQNPDQGSVVYVNSDDSFLDVQRPRLAAAEAQLPMVGLMRRMPPGSRFQQFNSVGPIEERLKSLKTAIQEAGDCKLAIVDDLARFVRDGLGKVARADLMLALESLRCLAAECDVAMIVVWRLERTSRSTARYLESFLPSAATAWLVGSDPYGRETRWVVPLKNQFGPLPEPMAFHIVTRERIAGGRVVWEQPRDSVPADVMAAFVRKSERRAERERAGRWALKRLAEGPVEADELWNDADAFGFSRRTMRRALVDLGLKPTKLGNDGPWFWTAERKRERADVDAEPCVVAEGQGDKETRGHGEVLDTGPCGREHVSVATDKGQRTKDSSHNPKSKIENPKSEDDADSDPIIPEDNEKVVIVVLRPTVPGSELTVEDGQLDAERVTQASGP